MSNAFTFNSVDCGDTTNYGIIVTKGNWAYIPTPKIDYQNIPFGGAISYKHYYQPRKFNLNCIISGTSHSDLESKIQKISTLFAQTSEKPIKFDNFRSSYFWNVRYTGGLETSKYINTNTLETNLEFTASDPIGFDSSNISSTKNITSTSFSFSELTTGNYYAKPIYIIHGTSSGTISLVNNTTSETFGYSFAMSNAYLKIDSELQYASFSFDGISYGNTMAYVSGRFPRLSGGTTNSFTLNGVNSGGTISISYNNRIL